MSMTKLRSVLAAGILASVYCGGAAAQAMNADDKLVCADEQYQIEIGYLAKYKFSMKVFRDGRLLAETDEPGQSGGYDYNISRELLRGWSIGHVESGTLYTDYALYTYEEGGVTKGALRGHDIPLRRLTCHNDLPVTKAVIHYQYVDFAEIVAAAESLTCVKDVEKQMASVSSTGEGFTFVTFEADADAKECGEELAAIKGVEKVEVQRADGSKWSL